jgi:hypothetical protein
VADIHASGWKVAAPAQGAAWLKSRQATWLNVLVALWVFCGGMVITEPSPYEVAFLAVLAVSMFGGFTLHRGTLGLLVLFVAFIPFATLSAFQVRFITVSDALIYQAVTVFLLFTSYWMANFLADDPVRRLKLVIRAYLLTALISAMLGTLGYLGIGHDLFTRYDRAKALFNDPNVYGPFLVLPAAFVLQRILLGSWKQVIWAAGAYGILMIGVFFSFSRAAWGHFAITSAIVFLLVFVLEATLRERMRMIRLGIVGMMVVVIGFAGLMSMPQFRDFFELRTQSQNYDSGESGRFGRQGYAFEMALEHPLGLGPLEFRNYRVKEEPHNTYVNVLHAYGWGGGLVMIAFIVLTILRGLKGVFVPGPHRLMLIPVIAVFIPLAGEAAIIDVDHWRHLFLVAGLVWGLTSARFPAASPRRTLI